MKCKCGRKLTELDADISFIGDDEDIIDLTITCPKCGQQYWQHLSDIELFEVTEEE